MKVERKKQKQKKSFTYFFFVTEAQSFTSPDQIPLRLEVHVYLPCGKRKR